jgi:trigger factor
VDKELEKLRDINARMVSVQDRPAKEGDMVIIDFKGFIGDEPFEGGSAENYSLTLGSGQFIEGFEDQLVGAGIGDQVDVNVTFPEDYHSEELAGEQAVFKVTVKEIKEKELPEVDDEFAKDVSEFDTLEQLKQDIKQNLEKRAEIRAKNEMQNQAVKKAVEQSEVDIPDVMIEKQIDTMVKDFEMQLMYQGLKLENYLESAKTSLEDFRNSLKKDAEDRVKSQLVIEKISKVEGITETQEELDAEIEEMAKRYRQQDVEKFKEALGENELNYLKDSIIVRKTIELLVDNANIK